MKVKGESNTPHGERKTITMQQKQQSMSTPPHHTCYLETEDTNHHNKLMAKLLDGVMVRVNKTHPAAKSVDDLRDRIQEQLNKLLPTFQPPEHPPYPLMIRQAIKELNEEGGSSEEAISKFIEAAYKDLPWGHSTMLKQHLKKLEDVEEIACVSGNCYALLSNFNSPGTPEQKKIPKKKCCQMEGRDKKHNPYGRLEVTKSQDVAVQESELVNVKEVVNKEEQTLLLSKAIVEKDHSKQDELGITMVSGQEKGSGIGDSAKVIHSEHGKIQNHKETEEVEVKSIGDKNQEGQCKLESMKERKEDIEPNGQKVPEESRLTCQEKVLVFGPCEQEPQENSKQRQQINIPVTESGMKEQGGRIVAKQTKESHRKYKSVDDSNLARNGNEFIENKERAQQEQKPVVVIPEDQSQDGQQIQIEEQTECCQHFEMAEQSKPSEDQENQVTCQKNQALMKPIDVTMKEDLTDGKWETDAIEEESRGEKQEDGSLVECDSACEQQVMILGVQNEGEKQLADAIGPHLQNKQMVIEEMESNINSLVQHNSSIRQESWEQEHQFKATNEVTISRKLEDHLLQGQGGQETISSSSNSLFASPDLGSYGSLHPGKEKCLEFLKRTIRLQEEFVERTIRLQEEYNKKIVQLQEELVMQLTSGGSSAHPTNHSRQNADLRDSAALHQQLEVNVHGKVPVMPMTEKLSYADTPMHELSVNPERLSVSNSKRLAEIDPSVVENLFQREEKRPRVSEQQDLMEEESNSDGLPIAMKKWLKRFEKNFFNVLGRLSERKLDRLDTSQQREHDALLNASPEILKNTIQLSLCQIGKEPPREGTTEGHSVDPIPRTLELCHVQLEQHGQQLHENNTLDAMKKEALNTHKSLQQEKTMPHKSLVNLDITMGQPGRAQGMINMLPQWQQQFDMQVSGKELCSQVITPIIASDVCRSYTLPLLNNSFIITFENTPCQPPSSKSDIHRTIVQALPKFQSLHLQWQESCGGGHSRGRSQGRGRAMQHLESMTASKQATLRLPSTPKTRGRPRKIKHDLTDVAASS